jgi:hypothetical protein
VSAVASELRFEVLRFAAEPVSSEVALLELEGRFRAATRRRLGMPRLVVEHAAAAHEVAPVAADDASAEPDGALWRASYAVPLEELGGGTFSLAVGRELLVGLPAPDPAAGAGTGDREVRLAREANALRRTADEARAAAAAALASAGDERRAREATEAELSELRLAHDDLSRRVAGVEEELAQARRDQAAALVRRDEELAQVRAEHAADLARREDERAGLLAGRDEDAARAAEERVAEIEAEAAEARRAVRAARAEAEGYRRELERAEAARAAVRRGRVTELAGTPVEVSDEAATEVATLERDPAEPAEAEATEAATSRRRAASVPPPSAEAGSGEGRAGETVRVLGTRRPRRTGEGPPAEPAPGTAAIGARFIEPAQASRRSAVATWLTRLLALAALAVAVVAILLVLKPL